MTRLAQIVPVNQESNRLMGMEWMAPKPDPRLQLMTRPAFVDQYLSDVMSGRIAKQGLTRLANVLNQATSGQPEGLLDYVGPGAMGTPFFRAMTAYHGSPHKFDKFKLSQIGTGEGAQAYGHGLYFAESPGVAQTYSRVVSPAGGWDLSSGPARKQLSKESFERVKDTANFSIIEQAYFARGPEAAKQEAIRAFEASRGTPYSDAFNELAYKVDWEKTPGHLYEVDIPDKYVQNFLDWDKPLSEQAESVRNALEDLPIFEEKWQFLDHIRSVNKEAAELAEDMINGPESMRHSSEQATKNWNKLVELVPDEAKYGVDFNEIHDIAEAYEWPLRNGEGLYDMIVEEQGSPQAASEYLNSLGIKGIKYLDQASRGAGEGTRNLVVFDEDIIKMLKRE